MSRPPEDTSAAWPPAAPPAAPATSSADASTDATRDAAAFIGRWQGVTASELSTAQSFVIDLCRLLGVPAPHPTPEQDYMFERPVTFVHGDGSTSPGRVDCYRRGHFVLESKKLKAGVKAQAQALARGAAHGITTKAFDDALLLARQQAENYARALPAAEGRPPFVVVVDVGHVIELYAEFTRSGATYTPYPDPRRHRIRLQDLADPALRQRLRALWLDPLSLDPSRASARVTRAVAAELAELARSLEAAGHPAERVAGFLTRCLFSMFAEDVGLLPKANTAPPAAGGPSPGSFVHLLTAYREQPATLQQMLRLLWAGMDTGGFNGAIAQTLLRFNGKLFKGAAEEGYALLLSTAQIDGLLRAASANWQEVEPAIFGTLLERALDPAERHALGAHYTPRAYVERLVLPTVVEPLRADWANAQAAALLLAREAQELEAHPPERTSGATHDTFDRLKDVQDRKALAEHDKQVRAKWRDARREVERFHHQLCSTRVLDPACGSGNFLYVTLEHLKRLEAEVLNQLHAFGNASDAAGELETVTLQQLRGIEINERAAALAELVLWIGWLQWQVRTRGVASVAEPVVHDYQNIEHRDAVLAYDRVEPAVDASGQVITRWDGLTFNPHPVTGDDVPDETARVLQLAYVNPRPAEWPAVEFIVGNPPFIGAGAMRAALGDGYAQTLRAAWPEVPESADFVMYWWHHAAALVRAEKAKRFGFITTNSLRQTFNRRVIEQHLAATANPLTLAFAVPDHPWVDSAQGAAVRIAMSVGSTSPEEGRLLTVRLERASESDEVEVELSEQQGRLHADLRVGADVTSARDLRANTRLSSPGVKLHGAGFIVTRAEAAELGLGSVPGLERHIREYRHGRDLNAISRSVMVIDLFGLGVEETRQKFPAVYQWLSERVKPDRDAKSGTKDGAGYAAFWWLFGKPRQEMRAQLSGLDRYVATVETSKHRTFQFLDASILPDNMLIAIASSDAAVHGVLSSQVHVEWALATGGRLGVGNDPRYNKSRCFETFPFPSDDSGLTPALTDRIRSLAEQLDAHRKARQAAHASVTLTGLYNVLDKLRRGETLTPKDQLLHQQGLVSVLHTLHEDLDAAVLQAYGWADLGPVPWPDDAARAAWTETLLTRLVALNARRAAEEATGTVRWLRPDFQDPARRAAAQAAAAAEAAAAAAASASGSAPLVAAAAAAAAVPGTAPPAPAAPAPLPPVSQGIIEGLAPPPAADLGAAPDTPDADEAPAAESAAPGAAAAAPAEPTAQPWPATLPEQVRAVAQRLAASPVPLALPALEAAFKGKGPWKKGLPRILDTLEAVGRAQRVDGGWRG